MLDDSEIGLSPAYIRWGDSEWNPGTSTAIELSLQETPQGDGPALPEEEPSSMNAEESDVDGEERI